MWTLSEALVLIQQLRPLLHAVKHDCGLTGSVMYAGMSQKDVDVIIYPYNVNDHTFRHVDVHIALTKLLTQVNDKDLVQERWKMNYSDDSKHVEVWKDSQGRRVDLFFMR